MQVHIGYFEDFLEMNAILISGDYAGLQELAELLRTLEDPRAEPIEISKLPFVEAYGGIHLTAYPVDEELGVRRIGSRGSGPSFAWHHSKEGWLEAAEKIDPVADSGGHCYLGCIGVEDATVMVSGGEYPESWWRRFG